MTTEKLFYSDPYLQNFTAQVDKVIPRPDGQWGVILDRTAFYPEGGGQPSDTGFLGESPVLDVVEENGELLHITTAKPEAGRVEGRIDWNRRFDHMQQHSGEHLLSAAFARLFQAENIGFHLGSDRVSIDLTMDSLSSEQAAQAEKLANTFVFANIAVASHHTSGDALADFPLRKLPAKSFANLRLIQMGEVDCCPCGGTHVATTGEIGLIKLVSWERKNSAIRVEFVCGLRALADYNVNSAIVRQLSSCLSVPPSDIPAAVERQVAKADALHKSLQAAKQELYRYLAVDLLNQTATTVGKKLVVKLVPDATPAELSDLAKQLLALGPAAILLGTADAGQNKSHLLFACTPDPELNMGVLLKSVLPAIGGKGGGNAHWAQGGGAFAADLEAVLQEAGKSLALG